MTKDQIKKEALSIFAQNGYEGGRLADIAKAVNIKTASLYFHFENKEQLFVELFDNVRDRKSANLDKLHEEIKEKNDTKDQLYHLYQYFSGRNYEVNEEELFWKRCTLFPPSFLKEKINRDLISYQKKFIEESLSPVILAGIASGELKNQNPEVGVVAFFGVIDALFNEIHYSKKETYRDKVKLLWKFYWDAVKK